MGLPQPSRIRLHTYNAVGIYTVTLTVSNEAGTDNETKTGYITVTSVSSKLAAAFTASPTSGNAPLKVVFTDKSTGSPTSLEMEFWRRNIFDCKEPCTYIQ